MSACFRPDVFARAILALLCCVGSGFAESPSIADRDRGADFRVDGPDSEGARSAQEMQTAPELSRLLAAFDEMSGFEARFEEEKTLSLLRVPLRSEGRLYFSKSPGASGRLLRRVDSPRPQEILISEREIRIREAGREEVIDLAARKEVRPLVESLLWLFSGDQAALEEAFEAGFERREAVADRPPSEADPSATSPWRLTLVPRDPSLAMLIDRLVVYGTGFGADRIDVLESGGDRSSMRVFEANPNRVFSEAEITDLFGLGPERRTSARGLDD